MFVDGKIQIDVTDVKILAAIARNGGGHSGTAYRAIGGRISQGSCHYRLQSLERRGLLIEQKIADRTTFVITPAGRAALDTSARADLGGSA